MYCIINLLSITFDKKHNWVLMAVSYNLAKLLMVFPNTTPIQCRLFIETNRKTGLLKSAKNKSFPQSLNNCILHGGLGLKVSTTS